MNQKKSYELIKFEDGDFTLDVNVSPDEETVWLSKNQIAALFDRDRSVISKHIKNIFEELECDYSNVQKMHVANSDKPIEYYNLDIIISVGYRVKSKRGIKFRKWANCVLKQYLLNGYAIHNDRILAYQSNILRLEANYINIENRIKNIEQTIYADNNLIVFEGEILKPYSFLIKLFFLAKEQIVIIDNYADQFLLDMLVIITVPVSIYTSSTSYLNKCEVRNSIKVIHTEVFHDRYIIIDNTTYTMGTSFNSIGKKRFTISKLEDIPPEMLLKNIK